MFFVCPFVRDWFVSSCFLRLVVVSFFPCLLVSCHWCFRYPGACCVLVPFSFFRPVCRVEWAGRFFASLFVCSCGACFLVLVLFARRGACFIVSCGRWLRLAVVSSWYLSCGFFLLARRGAVVLVFPFSFFVCVSCGALFARVICVGLFRVLCRLCVVSCGVFVLDLFSCFLRGLLVVSCFVLVVCAVFFFALVVFVVVYSRVNRILEM